MSTNDLQANSDLLFCPFCGGEAHIKEVVSACEKLYTVGCSDSECMGYETWLLKPTVDEAADAWNRRAERTCHLIHKVEEEDNEFFDTVELHYYVCSECGWNNRPDACYCDSCGARVIEEGV